MRCREYVQAPTQPPSSQQPNPTIFLHIIQPPSLPQLSLPARHTLSFTHGLCRYLFTPAQNFAHFFYLFATFEVVLQSSRYFIERGQLQGSGILSTVAGILPAPYSGYVRTVGRYSVIYSTVVSDAMVVVFVLGATSWWRGAEVA